MAILNYADKLEYIKDWENKTGDLRIIFTGDGHIITHGVDFTADYGPGKRGLVPICGNDNSFLKSTGWNAITTADLPITENILTEPNPDDTIPNTSAIKDFLNTTIQTAETLRFKGVIKAEKNKVYYKNSSSSDWVEGVPSAQMGDSYRVSNTDGSNICGYTVEAGDMLLCIANTG